MKSWRRCSSLPRGRNPTFVNKLKKNGKEAIIKFSKWTLTEEMVGDTKVGDHSFAEYIKSCYKK